MIVVRIDVMLAKRKMSVTELAEKVGITISNLSILKMIKPGRFGWRRWISSAKRWTANREICWNMWRTNRADTVLCMV